jgi:hypothetical protein
MVLEKFGPGWKTKFEPIIQKLLTLWPNIQFDIARRHSGMLQVKAKVTLDKHAQFIVDSTLFKIERISAVTCEHCGTRGKRTKKNQYLSEILCLCWRCEAIETNRVVSSTPLSQ